MTSQLRHQSSISYVRPTLLNTLVAQCSNVDLKQKQFQNYSIEQLTNYRDGKQNKYASWKRGINPSKHRVNACLYTTLFLITK